MIVRTLRRSAAVLAALAAVAVFALPASAKKQNVTFVNETDAPRYVLAVYGAGGACEAMPEKASFVVEPGESYELDTAGEKACWCAGRVSAVSQCQGWNIGRPAKKVRIER
jgi:hypothetical protein